MSARSRLDEIYAIAQHRAGYSAEEDAAHDAGCGLAPGGGPRSLARRVRQPLRPARATQGSGWARISTASPRPGGSTARSEWLPRSRRQHGCPRRRSRSSRFAPRRRARWAASSSSRAGTCCRRHSSRCTSNKARCSKPPVEPLGVVTAIAGQARGEKVFEGRADHAGTTPMDARRDALLDAARFILHVRGLRRSGHGGDRRCDRGRAERGQRRSCARRAQRRRTLRRRGPARRARRGDRLRAPPPARRRRRSPTRSTRSCPTLRGSSRARATTRWCWRSQACRPRCSSSAA